MPSPRYPALYEINTRVWLTELSEKLGRRATLDDIPDSELDALAGLGFDWIWLLSVWRTGEAGRRVSRSVTEWREEFAATLPDLCDDDICGSGFAIADYRVHDDLGGDAALARLRERLRQRGLRLMLDFVPNHMALDHPWVDAHPEYFVLGGEAELQRAPENYVRLSTRNGPFLLAHGRDPYFAGWPDTLQLNYANSATREAMIGELARIAGQCDGVRCDMAMLILPDVFLHTWGLSAEPFWPRAIERVRQLAPNFCFMAEVYWDLEWTLQQLGFDFTYDKRLYDRLRAGLARPVREHFLAGLDYQDHLARFLENHDEPRAATAFSFDMHVAAAALTYLSPGLRFMHQGQFTGATHRISPHLRRGPREPLNAPLQMFYQRLLNVLRLNVVRNGQWELLNCQPAWNDNWTWDTVVAFRWLDAAGSQLVVAVNYGPHQSQCYVPLPCDDLPGKDWLLRDMLGTEDYDRNGDDLVSRGLFLDLKPWQPIAFQFTRKDQ